MPKVVNCTGFEFPLPFFSSGVRHTHDQKTLNLMLLRPPLGSSRHLRCSDLHHCSNHHHRTHHRSPPSALPFSIAAGIRAAPVVGLWSTKTVAGLLLPASCSADKSHRHRLLLLLRHCFARPPSSLSYFCHHLPESPLCVRSVRSPRVRERNRRIPSCTV